MSDYIKSGWDFMKRHKKKFIALGVVGGASVGAYFYVKRLLRQGMEQLGKLGEDMRDRLMDQSYRASELQRISTECDSTIDTFLPPLRRRLFELTDPKPVTLKIKEYRRDRGSGKPENVKLGEQLWEELQTISLTRLVASVYALALLSLLMRLQLYVVGRFSLQETLELRRRNQKLSEAEKEEAILTAEVRESFMFLATDQLINSGDGMKVLVKRVFESIKSQTGDWHMGSHATVTRHDIHSMLSRVRTAIEEREVYTPEPGVVVVDTAESVFDDSDMLGEGAQKWLVHCLLGKNVGKSLESAEIKALTKDQNLLLREMLDETMDVIESPAFLSALDGTIVSLFQQLSEHVDALQFSGAVPSAETTEEGSAEPSFLLAKVVVNLKQATSDVLGDSAATLDAQDVDSVVEVKNPFVKCVGKVEAVKELCELVFQSGEPEDDDPLGLGAAFGGDMSKELMDAFSPEDMAEMTKLLGGLGGGGDGDANVMQLLSSLGGLMDSPQGGAVGATGEEAMLNNLMQSLAAPEQKDSTPRMQ